MTDRSAPELLTAFEKWWEENHDFTFNPDDLYETPAKRAFSAGYTAAQARIAELKVELRTLTTSGIIEVAVRNPSVMEYMRHWEARAEQAEAEVKRLRWIIAARDDLNAGKPSNPPVTGIEKRSFDASLREGGK